MDVAFGRESRWLFNAAIWYLSIDTKAKIRFRNEDNDYTRINVDVDVDPWVYSVGIGYHF